MRKTILAVVAIALMALPAGAVKKEPEPAGTVNPMVTAAQMNLIAPGVFGHVGDIELFNNIPQSDFNTAIAESPSLRLDADGGASSGGAIDLGTGDSTAPDFSFIWHATNAAGPDTGDSIAWEGATADAFETTLSATDVGADITLTMPGLGDASGALLGSTLTTNDADVANSIWGSSNQLNFEGATADAFETVVTTADVGQDTTYTFPDASSGAVTVGDFAVTFTAGPLAADSVDQIAFLADRAYTVTDIDAIWATAETAGTVGIMPERCQSTEAPGSGDDLLTAAFDGTTTAQTVNNGTLTGTTANLDLSAGDRVCIDFTDDTPGELAGVAITIGLVPN